MSGRATSRRRRRARPAVSFLAWTPIQGRSAEIAASLGGEAYCVYDRRLVRRSLVPLRYLLSAGSTVAYLVRRQPKAIVATNPPLFPGFIARAYGVLSGAPVVLDTHPGGFGAQGDRVSGKLQWFHRWLARRVTASMVTDEHWVRTLEGWAARGLVVHEAPPLWQVPPAGELHARPRVLFVGTFGGDEPVDAVFGAAARCPDMDVRVTGDVRRCPPELLEDLAPNITLTGFLPEPDYAAAIAWADVVLTLSTERTSVMRAAYEAVYAGRVLVLSDWPNLKVLFPHAVAVANTAEGVARGLRQAVADHARLRSMASAARDAQMARWESQREELAFLLGIEPHAAGRPDPGLHDPTAPRPPSPNGAGAARRHRPIPDPVRVAGIPVSLVDWEEVEAWAWRIIARGAGATLCTVAPYQAYLAQTDADYRRCLERAGMVLVDGNGVRLVLAAAGIAAGPRRTGRELVERVHAGSLLGGARVAVVGGSPGAHRLLAQDRPSWDLLGGTFSSRPTDREVAVVAARLAARRSQLVFVALGSPKMELWADALARRHPAVYASVGGAIDTVAGVRNPPPAAVSRLGLEFAWRAAQDPSLLPRLARGASAMPGLLVRAVTERRTQSKLGRRS